MLLLKILQRLFSPLTKWWISAGRVYRGTDPRSRFSEILPLVLVSGLQIIKGNSVWQTSFTRIYLQQSGILYFRRRTVSGISCFVHRLSTNWSTWKWGFVLLIASKSERQCEWQMMDLSVHRIWYHQFVTINMPKRCFVRWRPISLFILLLCHSISSHLLYHNLNTDSEPLLIVTQFGCCSLHCWL